MEGEAGGPEEDGDRVVQRLRAGRGHGTLLPAHLHHGYNMTGTVPGCGWWAGADCQLEATGLCWDSAEPALAHLPASGAGYLT